jgi:ApeA N-terminal domain 1
MLGHSESDGVWWVPFQPEQRSTGRIAYDAQTGLQLINIVGPLVPPQPQLGPAPEIILGYDHAGAVFTCVSSYYVGFSTNQAGINVAKMDVEMLIKGRHFTSRQDIRFRRFQSDYSNLHVWFHGLPPFQSLSPGETTINLEFLRHELWNVNFADGVRLRSSYNRSNHFSLHPDSNFRMEYRDSLWAEYENAVPPETFCRHERIFRTLVDLLGGCQLQVAGLKAGLTPAGTDTEIFYPSRFARNARRDANRDQTRRFPRGNKATDCFQNL